MSPRPNRDSRVGKIVFIKPQFYFGYEKLSYDYGYYCFVFLPSPNVQIRKFKNELLEVVAGVGRGIKLWDREIQDEIHMNLTRYSRACESRGSLKI